MLVPATFIPRKKCNQFTNSSIQDVYASPLITTVDAAKKSRLLKRNTPKWSSKRYTNTQIINLKRNILLLIGWIAFALVTHKVLTTEITEQRWDPYEILGVPLTATVKEVKKAFRKLSLKFHPDKVLEADKITAEAMFVDVSKAHKVLTNDDARAVFDEFGHPDGKQSKSKKIINNRKAFALGIALPMVKTKYKMNYKSGLWRKETASGSSWSTPCALVSDFQCTCLPGGSNRKSTQRKDS